MHREVADEEAGSLHLIMTTNMMIKMVKMEIVMIIRMIDMVSL